MTAIAAFARSTSAGTCATAASSRATLASAPAAAAMTGRSA